MKKKICVLLLTALLGCAMFTLSACKPEAEAEKTAYVSLNINPAIELIVDKDNNVVSVRGENEDGQILLYGETGIEGAKIDAAIQKITDLAVELGYLDEENKVVETLVSSGNASFQTEILNQVNTTITATASSLGLNVTTDGEGAYSLLRQMNEFKAQFPNNEAVQNISVQKFKLALSVSETDGISLDAAVEMNDAELIESLKTASAKIESYATEAYMEAKEKAQLAYDRATEIASYGVYTKFYLEKILSHPMTVYYGGVYQMYSSAAKGFEVICDMAELTAKAKKEPLDAAQIEEIATALGMESTEPLKNADGEITIDSIEAYADKMFKNSPAGEALEETKAALTEALSRTEAKIEEEISRFSEEYKTQIESAMSMAQQVLESVKSAMNLLPENVKVILNNSVADLNEILGQLGAIVEDGTVEIEELRSFAARLRTKGTEYFKEMKADLSEEEWAELEQRRQDAIDQMDAQKKELENAIKAAEQEAKDQLAAWKEARRAANK